MLVIRSARRLPFYKGIEFHYSYLLQLNIFWYDFAIQVKEATRLQSISLKILPLLYQWKRSFDTPKRIWNGLIANSRWFSLNISVLNIEWFSTLFMLRRFGIYPYRNLVTLTLTDWLTMVSKLANR